MNAFDEQVKALEELCPPVLAFAVGGSRGIGTSDELSDVDFFLLVPNDKLFTFAESFPKLISHPWPPLATRDRGFWPEFGYQISYVYDNGCTVDYFINSEESLRRTPMARKMTILKDSDGRFTSYQESIADYCASPQSRQDYILAAAAEILIELITILKYAQRGDLIPVLHRLERLRLVYLGLSRYRLNSEPYVPHDADKRVMHDLESHVVESITQTFPYLNKADAAHSFRKLLDLIEHELLSYPNSQPLSQGFWVLYREKAAAIERALLS